MQQGKKPDRRHDETQLVTYVFEADAFWPYAIPLNGLADDSARPLAGVGDDGSVIVVCSFGRVSCESAEFWSVTVTCPRDHSIIKPDGMGCAMRTRAQSRGVVGVRNALNLNVDEWEGLRCGWLPSYPNWCSIYYLPFRHV